MKNLAKIFVCFAFVFSLAACVDLEEVTSIEDNFSHEITKSYKGKGNIGYYIEGTVSNNSDNDYSYLQIEFICYDKDGNNLGTAIDNTNNLLGNQTWKFKAMGLFDDVKNVDHCDYHEITGW